MRKQTREDLEKIYREEDALKGCISRMCVTDEPKELSEMFIHARDRITNIYNVNWHRLTDDEETEAKDYRDVPDSEKMVKLAVTVPDFKVGNEVCRASYPKLRGVITLIYKNGEEDTAAVLWGGGMTKDYSLSELRKTGRQYSQIDEILGGLNGV